MCSCWQVPTRTKKYEHTRTHKAISTSISLPFAFENFVQLHSSFSHPNTLAGWIKRCNSYINGETACEWRHYFPDALRRLQPRLSLCVRTRDIIRTPNAPTRGIFQRSLQAKLTHAQKQENHVRAAILMNDSACAAFGTKCAAGIRPPNGHVTIEPLLLSPRRQRAFRDAYMVWEYASGGQVKATRTISRGNARPTLP